MKTQKESNEKKFGQILQINKIQPSFFMEDAGGHIYLVHYEDSFPLPPEVFGDGSYLILPPGSCFDIRN
jgi:hypothetical protein